MAEDSVLKMTICLQWDTPRPFLGTPRRSSSFSLRDREFYLQLDMFRHTDLLNYRVGVMLLPKERNTCHSVTPFSVNTIVLVKGVKELLDEFQGESVTVERTLRRLYDITVSKQTVEQLDPSDTWRIICQLSCDKDLSVLMNNQRIHLSTTADTNLPEMFAEKFVQASIEIPLDIEHLSEDFSRLLEKNIFPDVKLSCGSQTRSVHKCILAARSEVFNAMFTNKMVESETGTVDVPDLEAPVLDLVLKYVYSGKISDLSDETAVVVYEAADKYAILSLKMACSDWMVRNLTQENCTSFLVLADTHSDVVFKDAVISFISDHQDFFETQAWQTFSKKQLPLAYEIYHRIFVLSPRK